MIFAVDFDGTVVRDDFPNIGKEAAYAKDVLRFLIDKGHQIVLYTMRGYDTKFNGIRKDTLTPAIKWFEDRDLELSAINENVKSDNSTTSSKIYADYYIDDRSLGIKVLEYSDGTKSVDWFMIKDILIAKNIL